MKPFLLTIVGPFQPPNPPYFQSLVCNKAFSFFFFSKLIVFSDDFIAVTLHRTFTQKKKNLPHQPPFLVLKKYKVYNFGRNKPFIKTENIFLDRPF